MPGDLVGQSLAHFRIVEKIGEGGMGVVYKATDEKLRRQVALKVLPESFAKDEDRRRRFLREARSAAAITHANIATVYDVGEADGHVFIAMELVEGETLRVRIERGLSIAESVRIAREIARGLARAHEKGIVHRDLKPENVMITRHGDVKILDFGLAKLREETAANLSELEQRETATEATRQGKVLGTPAYMSPEQARGKDVDCRTDVFALGVVLFEMVTGERPFVGETTQDVLTAVMRDTPRRVSEVNPEAPVEIDRVVGRCLEKMREARYADGQALLDAVSAILPEPRVPSASGGRRGLLAPTASLLTPGASTGAPRGRAPWRWGLVALTGMVVALLGLGYRARGTSAPAVDAAPVSSSGGDSVAPTGRAITDHPPPRTKSPEALAAYASALQYFRDGSLYMVQYSLRRAINLDPTFAAAHLRMALLQAALSIVERRENYAAAVQSRNSLDDRDLMLLRAAEGLTREKPERKEISATLRDVLLRFPDDAETLYYLGALASDASAGRTLLEHALDVDPQFAGALQILSVWYVGTDDDEALRVSERCLALSPSAASCVRYRAMIHRDRGQCPEFEADARRNTMVAPREPRAYEYLAAALAARGAPLESVRAALDKRTLLDEETDPLRAKRDKLEADVALGAFMGDFAGAVSAISELDRLAAGDTSMYVHIMFTLALMSFLEEQGEAVKAISVAESFEGRVPASTASGGDGIRLRLIYAEHHVRRLTDAEFHRAREAFEQETVKRWGGIDPFWLHGRYAESPDEITDALPYLVDVADAAVHSDPHPFTLGDIGRVYLLAGKADDAIAPLRRAATACTILPDFEEGRLDTAVPAMQSHLWLGQALEAKGDKPGACEAYGYITDRWKNAPRSVTLEKAKARRKALGCPE